MIYQILFRLLIILQFEINIYHGKVLTNRSGQCCLQTRMERGGRRRGGNTGFWLGERAVRIQLRHVYSLLFFFSTAAIMSWIFIRGEYLSGLNIHQRKIFLGWIFSWVNICSWGNIFQGWIFVQGWIFSRSEYFSAVNIFGWIFFQEVNIFRGEYYTGGIFYKGEYFSRVNSFQRWISFMREYFWGSIFFSWVEYLSGVNILSGE